MKRINIILIISIITAVLLMSISVSYYYSIYLPKIHKEERDLEKMETAEKNIEDILSETFLDACLDEADSSLEDIFISLCKDNKQIGGDDGANCLKGTIDDKISYMTVSNLYDSLFKRIIDKREKERDECYMKYFK